jgi:hypothetical protein
MNLLRNTKINWIEPGKIYARSVPDGGGALGCLTILNYLK